MLTEITKSEVSSESINTNNSEVNMTAIENESININNSEVNMTTIENESINTNNSEVNMTAIENESININNSEVNVTASENESINREVNVNEAVINSEEAKMEVQHPKEKKARRTALDKDIDKAKERIANARLLKRLIL